MITKNGFANGPEGYERKFKHFIEMCQQATRDDVVSIATPYALGDSYDEIIESLNRLSDSEAMLLIDPRSQRRPSKGVTGSPPILRAIWVNKQKAVATQNSAECVELAILALAFSEAYQRV